MVEFDFKKKNAFNGWLLENNRKAVEDLSNRFIFWFKNQSDDDIKKSIEDQELWDKEIKDLFKKVPTDMKKFVPDMTQLTNVGGDLTLGSFYSKDGNKSDIVLDFDDQKIEYRENDDYTPDDSNTYIVKKDGKETRLSYLPEPFSLIGKKFKAKFDKVNEKNKLSPSQLYNNMNYNEAVSKALLFWMLNYSLWIGEDISNYETLSVTAEKLGENMLVTSLDIPGSGISEISNLAEDVAERFVDLFWDRYVPNNVINKKAPVINKARVEEDAVVNNDLTLEANPKDSTKLIPRQNDFHATSSSSDPFYIQAMNYGAYTIKDDLGQWSNAYDDDWLLGPMGYAAKYQTGVVTNLIYDNSKLHLKQIEDWSKTYFPGTVFSDEVYDFLKKDATNESIFTIDTNKLTFNGDVDIINVCMAMIATDPLIIRKVLLSKNYKYGKILTYDNAKIMRSKVYSLLVSKTTKLEDLLFVCGIALQLFSYEDYDEELAEKLGAGIDPKKLDNNGDLATVIQLLDLTLAKSRIHIKFKYKPKSNSKYKVHFLGDTTVDLFKNAVLKIDGGNNKLSVEFYNKSDHKYERELFKEKTNVEYYKKVGLDRKFKDSELIVVV